VVPKIQTHPFRRKSLPRAFLSRALASCGFALYDMVLGQGSLAPEPQLVGPMAPVVVRVAEPSDLEDLGRRKGPGAMKRFDVNEGLGSRCVVAVHGATLVGYAWLNTAFVAFLGEAMSRLPAGTLFIHDVFVFPEHRGKKVSEQLLTGVWQRGRAAGLHTAACLVDRANAPALAAFRRVGMRFRTAPIVKLPGLSPVLLGAGSLRSSEA
jgi:GNAT superfamily N-acetyltransferase